MAPEVRLQLGRGGAETRGAGGRLERPQPSQGRQADDAGEFRFNRGLACKIIVAKGSKILRLYGRNGAIYCGLSPLLHTLSVSLT